MLLIVLSLLPMPCCPTPAAACWPQQLLGRNGMAGAGSVHHCAAAAYLNCAQAHCGLAVVLQKRKDVAGAQSALRRAAAVGPGCALAHCPLGNLLLDWHKGVAGAESACSDAIATDPKFGGSQQPGWPAEQHEEVIFINKKAQELVQLARAPQRRPGGTDGGHGGRGPMSAANRPGPTERS